MATRKVNSVWRLAAAWAIAGMLALMIGGCDAPVSRATTADGKIVDTVAVNPDNDGEITAVAALKAAHAKYDNALSVLRAYYEKTGALDEQTWAGRELENLKDAQAFSFEGVAVVTEPSTQSLDDANEPALVEAVVKARKNWQGAVAALGVYYKSIGHGFKLALVRNVQQRFDLVYVYTYYLHAEIPPPSRKPTEYDKAGDELFEGALRLYKRGKPLPGITSYRRQRQALLLFRQLVEKYPNSTKIAQSAFYIGEIYREYFRQHIRAVHWYRRAWEWDPNTMLPARFRAAVTYDYHLAEYAKALKLYREVVKKETFDWTNVAFANRRIKQLSERK